MNLYTQAILNRDSDLCMAFVITIRLQWLFWVHARFWPVYLCSGELTRMMSKCLLEMCFMCVSFVSKNSNTTNGKIQTLLKWKKIQNETQEKGERIKKCSSQEWNDWHDEWRYGGRVANWIHFLFCEILVSDLTATNWLYAI